MAKVIYFGNLKKLTETKEENLDGEDIKAVLKAIKDKYGKETYKIAKTSHIVVNEENASSLSGFKTKIGAEDIVRFLPVCGGG